MQLFAGSGFADGVLSETINVFGEEEGNLEKESVEPSFKAIWEKIEEEKYALPKNIRRFFPAAAFRI